ncbi:hypothetical protein [Glacieibacterium frigidum]|uniref:Uncharacterized protein n=1 Tax=Glacieibacterium frigidum TaxID=2593303 RepID=A0A552UH38_9SPHN|nr:hypothetical protein [Glacieibacterium frigidum]TRW17543.1 hypothetical protein FMM06_05155 [Glacieibacterium frigidum]
MRVAAAGDHQLEQVGGVGVGAADHLGAAHRRGVAVEDLGDQLRETLRLDIDVRERDRPLGLPLVDAARLDRRDRVVRDVHGSPPVAAAPVDALGTALVQDNDMMVERRLTHRRRSAAPRLEVAAGQRDGRTRGGAVGRCPVAPQPRIERICDVPGGHRLFEFGLRMPIHYPGAAWA